MTDLEKATRASQLFQRQTAMDIQHHRNRAKALNKEAETKRLNHFDLSLLDQSLRVLADPRTGYKSSGPDCQCGCRELFKSTEK